MNSSEKKALLAKTVLLFGNTSDLSLISIAMAEAFRRCENKGEATIIKRTTKVFKYLLTALTVKKIKKTHKTGVLRFTDTKNNCKTKLIEKVVCLSHEYIRRLVSLKIEENKSNVSKS